MRRGSEWGTFVAGARCVTLIDLYLAWRMRSSRFLAALLLTLGTQSMTDAAQAQGSGLAALEAAVRHGYAASGDVRIHYVAMGDTSKPLVVLIHGFPEFWMSWRAQLPALARDYHVVAIDQRGYNLSDKPAGEGRYAMPFLVGDVAAVIRSLGREKAIVVGHDWGGAVAWALAMSRPELVEKLVILNLPHPRNLRRELATNPEQQANSQYARTFQQPGAESALTPAGLAAWVRDPEVRARYVEALGRSDLTALLAYYRQNYPREPYTLDEGPIVKVKAPVLMIHGLGDRFLLAGGLNDTWNYLEQDLTLVTIPGAGHFVQQEAADLVTRSMLMWLAR
jgi:epoxide hydrolase 4